MKKLVFINACIRGENSRTLKLADKIIDKLAERYCVSGFNLNKLKLLPLYEEDFLRRTAGNISNEILNIAEETAAADRIVIAAPFWDMSFPAALKTLIEQISINGIMFEDTPSGTKGLCRAEKILYITTRGMDISTGSVLEQASGYIKAVAHLWGIPECCFVSAIGTDIVSEEELQIRLNAALEEGLKIAGEF